MGLVEHTASRHPRGGMSSPSGFPRRPQAVWGARWHRPIVMGASPRNPLGSPENPSRNGPRSACRENPARQGRGESVISEGITPTKDAALR